MGCASANLIPKANRCKLGTASWYLDRKQPPSAETNDSLDKCKFVRTFESYANQILQKILLSIVMESRTDMVEI